MALRHAVPAALLDAEYSGYRSAKAFDVGVANVGHALPQQLYAEPAEPERDGPVAGRQAIQETRPDKRPFHVIDAGEEFLRRGERIGPYPTCLRGLGFEQEHRDCRLRIATVRWERRTTHAER